MVVVVQPYQHSPVEQLKTLFRLHYADCGVELANIRDFPHHGQNSDIKLVELIRTEPTSSHSVSAIIKTINLTDRHRLVGCHLARFLTREVVFYTRIFPSVLQDSQSRKYKNLYLLKSLQPDISDSVKLAELVPKCYFGFSSQLERSKKRTVTDIFSWFPLLCLSDSEGGGGVGGRGGGGMLVLEDLTRRPDKLICRLEKNCLMDFPQVSAALTSLAIFHGTSWRWVNRKIKEKNFRSGPNRKNMNFRDLQRLHEDSWFLGFCFKTIFSMMRRMLRSFLVARQESSQFVSRLDAFMKNDIYEVMQAMWSHKSSTKFDTIVHGSFWAANILFQYPGGGGGQIPQKVLLVDFQNIGLGNPSRDILSLLYTNTTAAFRDRYLEILLEKYYATFQQYFQGFFFMSSSNFKEFRDTVEQSRKFGLAWGLYIICVVLYPEAKAGWKAELNIKEVLEKRFEKISSTDPNVAANYLDIRARLSDVLSEAKEKNII